MDLPLDDHRVDPDAAVVDGHHPLDLPHAGIGVDLDRDGVGPERERQVRRVVVVDAFEPGLHASGKFVYAANATSWIVMA